MTRSAMPPEGRIGHYSMNRRRWSSAAPQPGPDGHTRRRQRASQMRRLLGLPADHWVTAKLGSRRSADIGRQALDHRNRNPVFGGLHVVPAFVLRAPPARREDNVHTDHGHRSTGFESNGQLVVAVTE